MSFFLNNSYKRAHIKLWFRILSLQMSASSYDNTVDIYALGLLLVEIFCPFTTEMERVSSLQTMRREPVQLPEQFARDFPNQVMCENVRFNSTARA